MERLAKYGGGCGCLTSKNGRNKAWQRLKEILDELCEMVTADSWEEVKDE